MRGLLTQPQPLLTDVQHQLGQTLLPDATDDALHIHLAEAQVVNRTTLAVLVEPTTGEIVPYN